VASLNFSGSLLPLSVAFIQETTHFREFGPLSGNTMRVAYEVAPKLGSMLSRRTIDADLRYYQRLAGTGVLAFRLRVYKSMGDYPNYMYFGGMSDMRGYDYLEFIGQNVVFANTELRFPIIEAMLTPIGVLGGLRGVFFFDIGAGWFNNQGFKFAATGTETVQRQSGVGVDANGNLVPFYDNPVTVSGFRLQDARASFGLGLETFIIGLPLHFDWAWRTTFNKGWEEYLFGAQGAADWRKARFSFWIGYDF
jgi:outer membrane protein assembly factor BamA